MESMTPSPTTDWITQRELAELLGISERTASLWAKGGKLEPFKHGVKTCGRRKYSKSLVQRELNNRWDEAVARQDTAAVTTNSESDE
ncbi:Helix-turn-helix domain protein [Bremerella volcania]|uniref:Helix-turn-helix domain protein n=1 Tax=Bremerella volcania TaxID=2527984 RepID=A0A518CCB4_9BACT|nr:helix-turn-helix domain-containing protein [Bremerella volcania]QDU76865.1 Helix-turn-helix domain protein [Bremerella volcania]